MVMTKNFYYQGPILPGATVCPAELNPHQNIRRLPAMADVGDVLTAGTLCYLTGSTNASDMTPTLADFGDASVEGLMCVVEIRTADPYFPSTTNQAVYPNKMPNETCTLTDYTHAANTNITVIPLDDMMWVWLVGSDDGTFDTTFMTEYEPAANGRITAIGGAATTTIDKTSHKFMSVATTVDQNWALFKSLGKRAHDN